MARTVLTIVSQLFDDPEQEVSLRENLPIRTLIAEARKEFNLPDGAYSLAIQTSGKVLDPNKTFEQAGIQTGAVLVLNRERRAAAAPVAPGAPVNASMKQAITNLEQAFVREERTGRAYDINFQPAIIGRPDSNNPGHAEVLAVDLGSLEGGKSVSRSHAQITEQKGHYFIEPLSEQNPLYLNDSALRFGEKRLLQPEDKIKLGNFTLIFGTRPL